MNTIIFIPGFAGSSLSLNSDEVWPPTLLEFIVGYHRISELQDQGVQKHGVIYDVSCSPVYHPIEDDLDVIANGMNAQKIDFDYDWRGNITTRTAPLLADAIAGLYANGARSIALVCHSLGGLVARLVLETPTYRSDPWFTSITQFVGICNPHHGAPLILAEALGLLGFQGISASDMPSLASDLRYTGGYQGLPAPGYRRLRRQPGNTSIDVYTTAVNGIFGRNSPNTKAAKASFSALNFNNRPKTVPYSLIAGSQQSTVQWVDVDATGSSFDIRYNAAGDGTVPLWSAVPGSLPPFVTPGDHVGIFKTQAFRQRLYQILTGGAVMPTPYAKAQVVVISLDKQFYAPGESMSVLVIPDKPTQSIAGQLRLYRAVGEKLTEFERYGEDRRIHYVGPDTSDLAMRISAPTEPGAYRMVLEESSYVTTDVTAAGFVVSTAAAPRLELPRRRRGSRPKPK
jgi:hypothetical protein